MKHINIKGILRAYCIFEINYIYSKLDRYIVNRGVSIDFTSSSLDLSNIYIFFSLMKHKKESLVFVL